MSRVYLEVLAILILIAANGFFSLSEFSIIASSRSRLKRLAKGGDRAAERAYQIHSHPESFLATVQLGITFVGIMAGVFSGMTIVTYVARILQKVPFSFVADSAWPVASVLVAATITLLAVIMGELVPKYIALSQPEKIAAKISGVISVFTAIGFFLVKALTGTAKTITRLFGFRTTESKSLNEEEIDLLIAEGREKGLFDATEQELIHSVFDFSDTIARQAMTPRTDIVGINIDDDPQKIVETITTYGYSRYPVYKETLDRIVGIIYTKDIIKYLQHSELIVINDIIRKPLFVPDSMKLNVLLKTFQQKRVHVAIVLDEFGGTAGLITLEDLLEEIVGEIQDEFDTEKRPFVLKSENVAFVAGSLRVDELNDQFGTELPEGDPDTVAGLVIEQLGRPAQKGEQVVIDNVRFTVLEVSGTRLKRLRVEKVSP